MINPREILTNLFVFFNPKFNYNEINLQTKKLIFIKKEKNNNENINNYIPCLFIPEFESSSKFLIFFMEMQMIFLLLNYFVNIFQKN